MSSLTFGLLLAVALIALFTYKRAREREAVREYIFSLRSRAVTMDGSGRAEEADHLRALANALGRASTKPPSTPEGHDVMLLADAGDQDELRASGFIPGTSRFSHAYTAVMRLAGQQQRQKISNQS